MAIDAFHSLTETEAQQLKHAPVQITLLIAGADDEIDKKETNWASKLVHYRTFTSEPMLHDYYEWVNQDFEKALDGLLAQHSDDPKAMVEQLHGELGKLGAVLEKLEGDYAHALLRSWRSLAKKVAEASGGLFGFASISQAEGELIGLPMIDFA